MHDIYQTEQLHNNYTWPFLVNNVKIYINTVTVYVMPNGHTADLQSQKAVSAHLKK